MEDSKDSIFMQASLQPAVSHRKASCYCARKAPKKNMQYLFPFLRSPNALHMADCSGASFKTSLGGAGQSG